MTTTFTRKAMQAAAQGVAEQRPAPQGPPRRGRLGRPADRGAARHVRRAGLPQEPDQLGGRGRCPRLDVQAVLAGDRARLRLLAEVDLRRQLAAGDRRHRVQQPGRGRWRELRRRSACSRRPRSRSTPPTSTSSTRMPDGVQRVIDTAVSMGIPRNAPGLDPNLSIVLGSATISPIDMANAYGTDRRRRPGQERVHVVQSVTIHRTAASTTSTRCRPPRRSPRTSPPTRRTRCSRSPRCGTGTNANTIGRPVAGKTGTATDDDGHVRSSWFVGYTPQLVTAVMYSRGNGNEPLDGYLDTFYGGEHPARTWAAVMQRALEGEDDPAVPAAREPGADGRGSRADPHADAQPRARRRRARRSRRGRPGRATPPSPTQAPPSPSDSGGPSVPAPSNSGSPTATQQPQGGSGNGNGQPAAATGRSATAGSGPRVASRT